MYNKQLDTFTKVVETGSFSKAAKELYITPSAVIQQINLLEQELQAKLLIRTNQGTQVTDTGKILYADAKLMIRQSEETIRRIRMVSDLYKNNIRIGTNLLTKCRVFPDMWLRFMTMEPKTEARIVELPSDFIVNKKKTGQFPESFDIIETLFYSELIHEDFEFLELCRCPNACAVPYYHPLASKKWISFEDLHGQPAVLPAHGISLELNELRQKIESQEPEIKLINAENYCEAIFSMCVINGYVLMTPACWYDAHPSLITIPCEWENAHQLSYGFLYRKKPPFHIQQFIDFIQTVKKEDNINFRNIITQRAY